MPDDPPSVTPASDITREAAAGETATVGSNFLKLGSGEAAARLIAFGVAVYLARTRGSSIYA